jgi:Methyltransferase domain
MLGIIVRKVMRNPVRQLGAIVADPLEGWIKLADLYAERRERRSAMYTYQSDPEWERRFHSQIGAAWPCDAIAEFGILWSEVVGSLFSQRIQVGPESFGTWNDGDAALVRAIWCFTRHLRPRTVVETGVAHGVTSRFILEALEKNGSGHLWSIDRQPLDPTLRDQIGIAVGGRLPERWSYISGSSRRRLPALLSKLGEVDLFIHDSLHSERNVRFEIDRAWCALRPGGAIIVDDIDVNWGFYSFCRAFTDHRSIVCESEPLRPDSRRFNKKGLFGILLKAPARL